MKKTIIMFLAIFVVQVGCAAQRESDKVRIKKIPVDQLPQYIGKKVMWKTSTGFREAILVKEIPQTSYCEVLFGEKFQSVCRNDKLYTLLINDFSL